MSEETAQPRRCAKEPDSTGSRAISAVSTVEAGQARERKHHTDGTDEEDEDRCDHLGNSPAENEGRVDATQANRQL